ncbi:MAG: nicotinamide-nucleotide amidohydrolase family protein [Candidatus Krumholzibacteria bacterium]|nr:nicotinamide-nucleotide amidohydrolase family protein [Candidatus Krumholzibacteria bacterium]
MPAKVVGGAVRIIAVGDELLEGRTADTNSRWIQQALGSHSVQVSLIQVVPDRQEDISLALDRTEAGDLVFVTGGLGSTPDDMTRDVVAGWAQVELIEDPSVKRQLKERWEKRGIKSSPGAVRQSLVPRGMTPLTNPVGSAPGLVGRLRDRMLVLLPGVPQELQGLLLPAVRWLEGNGALPKPRRTMLWRTAQASELSLVRSCSGIRGNFPTLDWSWWLTDWGVDVRLVAGAGKAGGGDLAAAGEMVDEILGRLVYSRRMETLPQVVQRLMLDRNLTLGVAESCTAGLIGGSLTEQPGSSGFFRGGILAYADRVKTAQLGVPAELLVDSGAVSEETVMAMADGCRKRIGTDYAVAVSGISGPDGGSPDKPVGTTWVAIATPSTVFARRYRFPADRQRNRLLTVAAAVDSLRRVLEFGDEQPPWQPSDSWCRPS